MYIGFLWIFRATELDGEMPGYLIGPCFVELVSSHDGVHWTREEGDRPPILPLGPDGAWDDGMVFTARAPIVEGDTIKLWYGGFDQVHGSSLKITTGSIGLATLRKDGFASLDAGATAGTILTKPLTGAGGALQVNYRAVGGSLKVEVLDENNNVLPGYSQADCVALTGDSVTQTVTWATHAELPAGHALPAPAVHSPERIALLVHGGANPPPWWTCRRSPSSRRTRPSPRAGQPASRSSPPPSARSSYQWQKNQVNLSDGGHYSGCTTATLTDRQCRQQRRGHLPLRGDQCLRERDQQPGNADGGIECLRLGHPHPYPHSGGRFEQ